MKFCIIEDWKNVEWKILRILDKYLIENNRRTNENHIFKLSFE
jgi:hypothetical protein